MKLSRFGMLVALVAALAAAGFTGHLGRVVGLARTAMFPKDGAMLAYFPRSTTLVGQANLVLADLPKRKDAAEVIDRFRRDIEEATGIRAALEIDAVAGAENLLVIRGRFHWNRMKPALERRGWTPTQMDGRPAAEGPAGQFLAIDGSYLVVGDRASVSEALERRSRGEGLDDSSPIVQAFDELGWRHTVIAGAQSQEAARLLGSEAELSVADAVLTGAIDIRRPQWGLRLFAVAPSAGAADALERDLERMRDDMAGEQCAREDKTSRELCKSLEAAGVSREGERAVRGAMDVSEGVVLDLLVGIPAKLLLFGAPAAQAPGPGEQGVQVRKASILAPFDVNLRPALWTCGLLVPVLLTIRRRERPGYFNVLFRPSFLVSAAVASVGLFVLRPLSGHLPQALAALGLPIAEWNRAFDPAALANPLLAGPAVPVVLAFLGFGVPRLRLAVAGIAAGQAGYLASAVASGGIAMTMMPAIVVIPWLIASAIVCLFIGRAMIPAAGASSGVSAR